MLDESTKDHAVQKSTTLPSFMQKIQQSVKDKLLFSGTIMELCHAICACVISISLLPRPFTHQTNQALHIPSMQCHITSSFQLPSAFQVQKSLENPLHSHQSRKWHNALESRRLLSQQQFNKCQYVHKNTSKKRVSQGWLELDSKGNHRKTKMSNLKILRPQLWLELHVWSACEEKNTSFFLWCGKLNQKCVWNQKMPRKGEFRLYSGTRCRNVRLTIDQKIWHKRAANLHIRHKERNAKTEQEFITILFACILFHCSFIPADKVIRPISGDTGPGSPSGTRCLSPAADNKLLVQYFTV